jgi:hypothetical protein
MHNNMFSIDKTKEAISEAREIMESFDPSPAMTVGYDLPSYTLTSEQMAIIAGALYLADCEIHDLENIVVDLRTDK